MSSLTNETDAEDDDGGETKDPENNAQRLDAILVSDDKRPLGARASRERNGMVGPCVERRSIADDENRIRAGRRSPPRNARWRRLLDNGANR